MWWEKQAGAYLPLDLGGDVYRDGLATEGWLRLPSRHWGLMALSVSCQDWAGLSALPLVG